MKFLGALVAMMLVACSVSCANITWEKDYQKAAEKAKTDKKPLFLLFTGTDWCPACQKLERDILSKPGFAKNEGDKFIFVEMVYPFTGQFREHNDKLAKKYSIRAYPTMVILDSDENKLDEIVGIPEGGSVGLMQRLDAAYSKKTAMNTYSELMREGMADSEEALSIRSYLLGQGAEEHLFVAVWDFQNFLGLGASPKVAMQPLVDYLRLYDNDEWKVDMILAQYLHSLGDDAKAQTYAQEGYQAAPLNQKPVIESFLATL